MTEQETEELLQQEYDRFVEFGNLLNRRMRRYLVQYLQNKLTEERYVIPELDDRYYDYFRRAVDRLFAVAGLTDLTGKSHRIRRQIVMDTLRWFRKAYADSRAKNPHDEELQRLESWSVTPLKIFIKRWGSLITYLSGIYPRTELDTAFFRERFDRLIASKRWEEIPTNDRTDLELLLKDILAQWDALLYAKILDFQLNKLAEEEEAFVDFVSKKVEEYQRLEELIQPFSDYLGWDLSRDLWEETSFDILNEYNDILEQEHSVRELADLLGRLREAEIEIEEERFERTIIRQEWVVDEYSRAEIVGVQESDDLTNMLSAEASLLADEDTELVFLKRYADKNLLTFRYEDRKLVKSEDHFTEINQRIREREKGPFIICVDTSESMYGRPEQIAKVLTLAVLKMAMADNRRAYLINFSRGIKTLDLYDIANSVDEIAAFLRMSFYGGTNPSLALYEALRQLGSHDYQDADVLMVSDFIMYRIEDDVLRQIKYFQQNKATQFHSLTLSKQANPEVLDYFDTNWIYDPKEKGIIKSLTEGLRSIERN